jgi:serine/threonine-protein kinase
MFIDEANLASRIRHPNVVPVLDVLATDGELFLVMDFVHGVSLSRLIAKAKALGRPVPLPVALGIMIGAFLGLHAAHEAVGDRGEPLAIVHRDVSPQNILVGDDGVARLLDFGIAKAASRLHQTAEGDIKGKIAYMSPEQAAGSRDVDRRTDVFAGSVVLWELLTSERLFGRDTSAETFGRLLKLDVDPPSTHNPDVSAALDELVLRGISRAASARPPTALEVARSLEACGRVASAREIGEWVTSQMRDELDGTVALVAEMERISVVTAAAAPIPASAPSATPATELSPVDLASSPAPLVASVVSRAEPTKRRRQPMFLALTALLAVVGVLAITRARQHAATVSSASSSQGEAPSALVASAAPPPVTTTAAPPVMSSPATEPQAATVPSLARSPAAKGATVRAHTGATNGTKRDVAPSKPPTDCRVLLADGTFGYRPECVR